MNDLYKTCIVPKSVYEARGIIISLFFYISLQHMFFFLIQTEQGDIFKVTLETDDDVVSLSFPGADFNLLTFHDHA